MAVRLAMVPFACASSGILGVLLCEGAVYDACSGSAPDAVTMRWGWLLVVAPVAKKLKNRLFKLWPDVAVYYKLEGGEACGECLDLVDVKIEAFEAHDLDTDAELAGGLE